ncbi:hypothetical protein CALCODRAFT_203583 [Calocera cornea HHB12733]|uniref:HCP-like protein n=1 Tax=Calocera cornea HHB12733 TaxID=1353952 RepID=A0A165JYV6_9BASI|nr:hypothetical protein CALCODRAFT_203583 [Calocera cornea HHB12733]
MCLNIVILSVIQTGKSPPMEIDTLQTPLEEEKAEEHFSRLDVDYYNFRLEHGDCLANFGMAVMEERQIRTKVELDKEFLVDLDEPRKRLLNYLDEAIEHNFGAAAFKAGSLFEEGIVLPLEGEKAVEYYEKALALGYTYAAVRLGYLYKSGPMSLKGQPKVKSDRRKSLEYFEMAAEKWPAAALQVAQAYYRRHGFTSEEHSRTYQTDPNDEKAAHLFSLAADKNSWISARMLSDILLMDRADVPKRRMDDAKRQQPKRVRQLEYAVALLKSIPQSDQKKCFIIGWDDSYKLACRLLEAAKKGNRAMDFDPVKLTSWTKWSPAFKAIGPPRNSRRSNGAAGIRKHISEAEKKSIEEKRREVLMGSLMSQVKVRLKGGPPKRSPTRPRATIASGPGV